MLITSTIFSKGSLLGSILNKCRPIAVANINTTSPALKTIEEQIGLSPRPKKPLTPYFRFMKELRPKITTENPNLSTTEIVRLLSKKWETVELSHKERLQEDYKRDLQKYVELRAKYDAKISDEQRAEMQQLKQDIQENKQRKILRKRIRELGRPKRPSSAFFKFVAKERIATPQHPKQSYREWHQECANKWTNLTESEKAPYLEESRKDMEKYKKEISTWEEQMVRSGHTDVVRSLNLIDPPEPKSRKN